MIPTTRVVLLVWNEGGPGSAPQAVLLAASVIVLRGVLCHTPVHALNSHLSRLLYKQEIVYFHAR